MKTGFFDGLAELKDLYYPKLDDIDILIKSFKIDLPKIAFPKESLNLLSASLDMLTTSYNKAVSDALPTFEFAMTVQTALEAYRHQLTTFDSLEPADPCLTEIFSALISDSVVGVADHYRPYMTEEQIEDIEEAIPALSAPKTRKEKPKLSLEQLQWLIPVLLSLIQIWMSAQTGRQLNTVIDNHIAQIEQDAEQHKEEIAILTEMSTASKEMNDLLQRIVYALEDADDAADLVSQDPGDFIQPDNDLGELTDLVGHDSYTGSHEQNGDTEPPTSEP